MRYKSEKKSINRRSRRVSRRKRSSRKIKSKRQRQRQRKRQRSSRRRYSQRQRQRSSRRIKSQRQRKRSSRRKHKSLKGGMIEAVKGIFGPGDNPSRGKQMRASVEKVGTDIAQSVKQRVSPHKSRFEKTKAVVRQYMPQKKKKSHFEELLYALETKLSTSVSSTLEHVETTLTKDVGFILSSLQHLSPEHFTEKIKLLQKTTTLVCDYAKSNGKSFAEILNDPELTETAIQSSTETGYAFKVCHGLQDTLKKKSHEHDLLHVDLFHLTSSIPFHNTMMSFKTGVNTFLQKHDELSNLIGEVKDDYESVKEQFETKEKEFMEKLGIEGNDEIKDEIKELLREELHKLEGSIGEEVHSGEEQFGKLLVKIHDSSSFEALKEHLQKFEGDRLKEIEGVVKQHMLDLAVSMKLEHMKYERDKVQLFSLLMMGCMCVKSPLEVIQRIYNGKTATFQKHEFKTLGKLIGNISMVVHSIGNKQIILQITVKSLNHTIQTNPTVINQNEEIKELVNAYMPDQTDQTDQTGQISDKLQIILSQDLSSKDETERGRFSNFVKDVVAHLVHHYKDNMFDMFSDIATGVATVGSLGLGFGDDHDDDEF